MYVGPGGEGDYDKWYRYTHPNGTGEGVLDGIGNDITGWPGARLQLSQFH